MLSILTQYRAIKNNLGDIIKNSGYRNDYIAKKLGITPQAFAVKKQRNNFNDEEIEKILVIIDNEDTEDYVMLHVMRALNDEETVSLSSFKREMGWK